MTRLAPEEVRSRIADIRTEIEDHKIAIKKLALDIERVQLDCPHQNVSKRCIGYADERWSECDDCGREM